MKKLILLIALLPIVVFAQQIPYTDTDTATDLPAVSNGSIATADFNNDGNADFLVLGTTVSTPSSSVSITNFFQEMEMAVL